MGRFPRIGGRLRCLLAVLLLAGVAGCATARPLFGSREQVGLASYYAAEFQGRRTASGEVFDRRRMTAAHPTLPFGTWVRVVNLENGRRVMVRINDRGPHKRGRIIDVSEEAARRLGFVRRGIAKVRLVVL